ncbi:restriction endonuclease subunit S [Vibrio vulnificus]|nr:restriction endonuclease subunit S [Vibrio vulnificus]
MTVPLVKISEVAETTSGGTPARGVKTFYGGDIPWIKSGELPDGEILSVEETITQAGLEKSSAKLVPEGTLVIAMYGATVGRLGILTFPAATNQAVCAITPDDTLDRDYLFYWLLSIRNKLIDTSFGGAQPNISQSVIRELEIPLPQISEQRKIAASLKAQLTDVETARQAALVQLSDVRLLRARMLKAFFAELDSVPKKRLGDNAPTASGSTPSRGNKQYWEPAEIAWVKTGEVAFAPITSTEEAISNLALDECSLKLLPPKTILIAMYGQGKTRGQSAILEIPATTNQACFAIMPNNTWDPDFLYLWLKSSYQDLRELSADRGGNQANLNGALLKSLEIPAPDKTEQKKVVKRIQTALTEIDALEQSNKAVLADIEKLPARILTQAFEK